MFEPVLGWYELVAFREELAGRIIEQPHPLVGAGGGEG
jgi:hypothetical protein